MADKDNIIEDLKKAHPKPSHEMQDGQINKDQRAELKEEAEVNPHLDQLHVRNIEHALSKGKSKTSQAQKTPSKK